MAFLGIPPGLEHQHVPKRSSPISVSRNVFIPLPANRAFLEKAFLTKSASGGKSTALRPIQWAFGMSCAALLVSVSAKAPFAVSLLFGIIAGSSFVAFCIAYFFFMVNQPDNLRSEWYVVEMTRLEKGLIGDSTLGVKAVPLSRSREIAPTVKDVETQ